MSSEHDKELVEKLITIYISRRKFLAGTGAVAAGGLLAACGQAGPTPTMRAGPGEDTGRQATDTPKPEPTEAPAPAGRGEPEGTLTWLSAESFSGSWDPIQHTILATYHAEWNCFDRLFNLDWETKEFLPALALAYKVIPEGLELTLREGVKFHEGQPFTAADVKHTLERATDQQTPHGSMWPGKVEVNVVDDYTAQIITKTPLPVLNSLTLTHMTSKEDDDEKLKTKQNGTGPFVWDRYEGETVYYTANMDYWKGPPRLKDLHLTFVGDPSTRLAALQTGEADIIERVPGDHVVTIEEDTNLDLQMTLGTEQTWVCFKCTSEWTGNKLVRQAIGHCVDQQGIVDGIMGGYAAVPEGYNSPMLWPFGAPAPTMPRYDLEAAKQKLAEAGFPGGEGLPELYAIGVAGFYPNMKEYMEYIAAECAKAGINIRVEVKEVAAWLDAIYQEDSCDLCFHGWNPPAIEPDITQRGQFYTFGRLNFLSDPAVDAALDKQSRATDLEERKKIIIDEVMPALADADGSHPILTSMVVTGQNKKVKNFFTAPTTMFELWDTYVEA